MLGVALDDSMTRYSLSALLTLPDTQQYSPEAIVGSGEVVQAVDPAGRVVLHEKHDTSSIFHTGEQEQMIGADDKHGVRTLQPTARYTRNRDQQANRI